MRKAFLMVTVLAALGTAGEARAQWEVPSFLPPQPGEDIGIYLVDPPVRGSDFGIHGIWRQEGNLNLGLRLGLLFVDNADDVIGVGAEFWDGLFTAGPDFPVDVTWTLGFGAAFNGATILSVPAGLSIGRTFALQTLAVQVYGHPRLALVVASANDQTETDLEAWLDLGADAHLGPNWKLRFGASLGGPDALGVGLAYRFGRTAVVR